MRQPSPSPVQIGAAPQPQCRTCIHWKRRDMASGDCFNPSFVVPMRFAQEAHCREWTPKVVKV